MSYKKIHQLKVDFHVTESIKRFVYVYIIEAENCYLIDSGVYGCETQIAQYMESIGRKLEDIKKIFLTHAHPDHIGSAAWFQDNYGCEIYASEGEKRWIEDIDLQFRERPIPNFYQLAGKSSRVDFVVKDGDVIELEHGVTINAVSTAGHSRDEMSYRLDDVLFIGDTVPVKGDIPIFIDEAKTRASIQLLENMSGITVYYPAWDHTYLPEEMKAKLAEAKLLVNQLKNTVIETDTGEELSELTNLVCEKLQMPMLKANPLFAKTIESLRTGRKKMSCYFVVDTYINQDAGRGEYDEYIAQVKPIVESYGGEYLVRSENIISLSALRNPQRVIIVRFPSKQALHNCFASDAYKEIMNKRIDNVDARAVIVDANE